MNYSLFQSNSDIHIYNIIIYQIYRKIHSLIFLYFVYLDKIYFFYFLSEVKLRENILHMNMYIFTIVKLIVLEAFALIAIYK